MRQEAYVTCQEKANVLRQEAYVTCQEKSKCVKNSIRFVKLWGRPSQLKGSRPYTFLRWKKITGNICCQEAFVARKHLLSGNICCWEAFVVRSKFSTYKYHHTHQHEHPHFEFNPQIFLNKFCLILIDHHPHQASQCFTRTLFFYLSIARLCGCTLHEKVLWIYYILQISMRKTMVGLVDRSLALCLVTSGGG